MARAIGGREGNKRKRKKEEIEKELTKLENDEDTSFEMGKCLGCFSSVEVLYYFIVKVKVFCLFVEFFFKFSSYIGYNLICYFLNPHYQVLVLQRYK